MFQKTTLLKKTIDVQRVSVGDDVTSNNDVATNHVVEKKWVYLDRFRTCCLDVFHPFKTRIVILTVEHFL